MPDMSPAHRAVELENLPLLCAILDDGADPNEEHTGLPLLHHSIDIEIDGHVQTGEPLHVDATALLLAKGADPRRRSNGGAGISAEYLAHTRGHWLAEVVISAWLKSHTNEVHKP